MNLLIWMVKYYKNVSTCGLTLKVAKENAQNVA